MLSAQLPNSAPIVSLGSLESNPLVRNGAAGPRRQPPRGPLFLRFRPTRDIGTLRLLACLTKTDGASLVAGGAEIF
jgi:hypothetical protein